MNSISVCERYVFGLWLWIFLLGFQNCILRVPRNNFGLERFVNIFTTPIRQAQELKNSIYRKRDCLLKIIRRQRFLMFSLKNKDDLDVLETFGVAEVRIKKITLVEKMVSERFHWDVYCFWTSFRSCWTWKWGITVNLKIDFSNWKMTWNTRRSEIITVFSYESNNTSKISLQKLFLAKAKLLISRKDSISFDNWF